jgi:hypothetical protein
MVKAENACTSYAERWVNIYFTDKEVCCKFCPLLETYSRKQCRKTGEYITNENVTGYWCPLLKPESNTLVNERTGEVIKTYDFKTSEL